MREEAWERVGEEVEVEEHLQFQSLNFETQSKSIR